MNRELAHRQRLRSRTRRIAHHLLTALAVVTISALTPSHSTPRALPQGPGLPKIQFAEEEVGISIAALPAQLPNGMISYEHGQPLFLGGYLVVPISQEKMYGGFQIFDISDPRHPALAATHESVDMRETHNVGIALLEGRRYAVFPAAFGIQIWDFTAMDNPSLVTRLTLPGILPSDYSRPAWWVTWQAPWIYVAGASQGLYIIDARNPRAPHLVRIVSVEELGLPRVGSIQPIGNLLIASAPEGYGISTLDIGDPTNPQLLGSFPTANVYSANVAWERVFAAGINESSGLLVLSLADPRRLTQLYRIPASDRAGYVSVQDQNVHLGGGTQGYMKLPIDSMVPQMNYVLPQKKFDLDFTLALGNLVAVSDDEGNGTHIVVHDKNPDTIPPAVTMVMPRPEEKDANPLTRVGLVLSDQIDSASLSSMSVQLLQDDGAEIPADISYQGTILNIGPRAPLPPGERIHIRLPAGGVQDISGNSIARELHSVFVVGKEREANACTVSRPDYALTGEEITYQLHCSSPPESFVLRYGDGTEETGTTKLTHRYQKPGRYQVQLEGKGGERITFLQTITRPLTSRPPIRSQQLLLDEERGKIVVVTPDSDSVTAFRTDRLKRVSEHVICEDPRYLARSEEDELWVSCRGGDQLIILDRDADVTLGRIALPHGSRPAGIIFSGHDSRGYLALEGMGEVAIIHSKQRAVVGRIAVGPTPRGLALRGDGGALYVTRLISPDTHGEVVKVDLSTLDTGYSEGARIRPATQTIVLPFDQGPDTAVSGRGVPNYLQSATISPDGSTLVVPAKKDNIARGLQRDGQPLGFASTVRSIVSLIDLEKNEEEILRRKDIDNRSLPSSATFSPRGDLLFVTTSSSNTVEVLDPVNGEVLTSIEHAGHFPVDSVIDKSGETLYVLSINTPEIIVYDVRAVGRTNLIRKLQQEITVAKSRKNSAFWIGKRTFSDATDRRMSRNGYLSCVVCHLDGEQDGRVWDFTQLGEGLRNTVSLAGRGASTGPLHWSGNFDEVQDFDRQIRELFDGTGFIPDRPILPDADTDLLGPARSRLDLSLDLMALFVRGLSIPPRVPQQDAEARARGEQLFRSAELGCASCHRLPELTDSEFVISPDNGRKAPRLHDVGTLTPASGSRLGKPLTGLDTPSLGGLAMSAPYLHDGSARTVEEVLTVKNRADRHGKTSQLSKDQVGDLVAYLLSLE